MNSIAAGSEVMIDHTVRDRTLDGAPRVNPVSVTLKLLAPNGSTVLSGQAMTLVEGEVGRYRYLWQSLLVSALGIYSTQVTATDEDGRVGLSLVEEAFQLV